MLSYTRSTVRLSLHFFLLAIASIIFLTGCLQTTKTVTTTFPAVSSSCAETVVPGKYIAHWADGTRTIELGGSHDEFARGFVTENLQKLDYVEPDFRVQTFESSTTQTFEHRRNGDLAQTSARGSTQASIQHRPRKSAPNSNGNNISSMLVDPSAVDPDWGQRLSGANDASDLGFKGEGQVVAVIDTGVDVTLSQLRNQIYINTKEIAGNGIDDDGNGYIDDVYGYDFTAEATRGVVTDTDGHGTHVAGIIGADPSQGSIKGVAAMAKILPIDFLDSNGSGDLSDGILGIEYAATRGVKIINASWGGNKCSLSLSKAISAAGQKGILFISAAGNDGVNLEYSPSYPAAYGLSNQITVAAHTITRRMAGFSNFSYKLVDLAAPGDQILSTYPRPTNTSVLSGTSMATPFVSGAAAVVWAARPKATAAQVKEALLSSVTKGQYSVATQGQLNVLAAVRAIQAAVAP
jgi:subtilisin family serine protease